VFRFPKEWRTDFKVGERSSCKLEERDAVSILDCLLDVGEKAVNDDSYLVNQLDALGYGTWRYEALPSLLRYEPFTTAAIFYQDFWKIAVVIRAFWKDRSHPYRVAVAIEKDYLDRGFGSKGTIGISSQIPPDPTILRMLSTDHGVVVADVDPNGPAAKAGIQAGDVILSTDYRPVWDTLDLVSRLDESLGSSIRVTFLRDAKENEVKIMVTENKAGETDSSSYLRGFEPKRK